MINIGKEKLNNRSREGFSLIELVITIVVLAIMVGIISLSTALLRSADTRGLANEINDSFTDLKSLTEAHTGPYYLHLYKNDGSYWKYFDTSATFTMPASNDPENRIGPDVMSVNVIDSTGTNTLLGAAGCESITVSIKKKDGSYNPGVPSSMEVYRGSDVSGTPDYRVVISEKTGLHYVD